MSRVSLPVARGAEYEGRPIRELIVGLDRPLRHWFFQLWGEQTDDEVGPLNDSLSGCSQGDLLEAINTYADLGSPKVRRVSRLIALDLDPAAHGDIYV